MVQEPPIRKPSLEQIWRAYSKAYHLNESSVHQVTLISIIATEILKDFPKNLPRPLGSQHDDAMLAFIKTIVRGLKEPKPDPDGRIPISFGELFHGDHAKFTEAAIMSRLEIFIAWFAANPNKKPDPSLSRLQFEPFLRSQQLVMLLAQLDAFLADTVRCICQAKPDVLKKQSKVMPWETILMSETFDDLVDQMADEFAYDLGWRKDVANRVKSLSDLFGLHLPTSDLDLSHLLKMEKVRDIVLHNGGRISGEFLRKTRETNLKNGDVYPISYEEIEQLALFSRKLCGSVFGQVSSKFFGKDLSKINIADSLETTKRIESLPPS